MNIDTITVLRECFGIDSKNNAMASRIIKDALLSERIRVYDETVGSKAKNTCLVGLDQFVWLLFNKRPLNYKFEYRMY